MEQLDNDSNIKKKNQMWSVYLIFQHIFKQILKTCSKPTVISFIDYNNIFQSATSIKMIDLLMKEKC